MTLIYDQNATLSEDVVQIIEEFLAKVSTLETVQDMPIVIFQDGVNSAYYIKCSLSASDAANLCDLNAKLDLDNPESFKANRKLLLKHKTYKKMVEDVSAGREFNDIIVEYNTDYNSQTHLKVWGGQHRISAIKEGGIENNRYHGFRIYFNLTKKQRTEVALISNTNIAVSNDTFDRMVEETVFGDKLRKWCQRVGLLDRQWFQEIGLSDTDEYNGPQKLDHMRNENCGIMNSMWRSDSCLKESVIALNSSSKSLLMRPKAPRRSAN